VQTYIVQMDFELFKDRSLARCIEASNQIEHNVIIKEHVVMCSAFWHIMQTLNSIHELNDFESTCTFRIFLCPKIHATIKI
jgi:hypothetical protein